MEINAQESLMSEFDMPSVMQVKRESKSRPIFAQAITATLVYLTAICNGLSSGYSAILLPQLRANNSGFELDEDIESWIVSIYIGATPVGCLLSGIMMDVWGRRPTVQIAVSFVCVGWILIATSSTYPLMLVGRALGGFGKGATTPAITFHLEEMADPRLRGTLSACILLMYSIGIMLISLIGTNMSWKIAAGLAAVIGFGDLVGYSLLHESPVWLVRNNHINKANQVFSWLWGSGHPAEVERDLQKLLKRIKDENTELAKQINTNVAPYQKWKQYFKPQIYKPFIIVHVFNIIQIICGTNLFIFYAVDIISGLNSDGSVDINLTTILTSIVRVVFMVVSCIILVWIGRRTVCISSGLGSGIAAILIGTVVRMQNVQAWIIVSLVLIYVAFNTYGYFVLPPSMIGEILPSKIRCVAGAYIFTMNDIGMFCASKAFPSILNATGIYGLFWIFGVSSLACSLFLYLMLPETKGRSLVQIEEYFLKPNVLWLTSNKAM
ncbi:facilitated trehalose transporter Tret1-like isoform X2 [Zootermopsis nevadensis]|uniref:Putative metabolite transport protein csbC n=2 Tax=Zootermopsis nevadensis TaxID=136037 RepID=A0A067RFZ7_ZOONE|nr:facilitated trehalose transporter Tret1-like isoform X2 [Zootermopsis nevadensis]XP_021922825.1 facilitated trehalose transporter Tret1-like isoform X2 [Zootermopsis nevadensis]XP_021922826.1 facilitated trehalose transporter Tret1-like isoform X2 [Zootermopsis nevadensis]KDR17947.1 putative metabolite transport protein csbC [Zootermopsis nevadensis]